MSSYRWRGRCAQAERGTSRCAKRRGSNWGCAAFWRTAAFTRSPTLFRICTGSTQLPGIAVQRLMADGYGFGAEGDWKTAALVRAMKVMGSGLTGGTSFMEDYTYHFEQASRGARRAHAGSLPLDRGGTPTLEIHPLSIGGKADPVRLVFTAPEGPAVNASSCRSATAFA